MGAYHALKELMDYSKLTGKEITYDSYYFKCGDKMLDLSEYEMSSAEESVLHGLYLLYETKLDGVLGKIFKNARSVEFQREFYTKLFIYDKISQVEKENGISSGISTLLYSNYVVEFNTTSTIDGEASPKRAMDMFQSFAKDELKQDKEFLNVITTFKDSQMDMILPVNEEENSNIYLFTPPTDEKAPTSNQKQATVISFCKKMKERRKD